MPSIEEVKKRSEDFRRFLFGGEIERRHIILDPSSYAAEFAGKSGGYATFWDNLKFKEAYPNDSFVTNFIFPHDVFEELRWSRRLVEDNGAEKFYEERLKTPGGEKRRVIAEKRGTTPWLIESAVKTKDDFSLLHYYADVVKANARRYADALSKEYLPAKERGHLVGSVVLIPFECWYLIDYADMPLLYYDFPDEYLMAMKSIHEANLMVMGHLKELGCDMIGMGSAGLELLSPRIFDEAIIPFARETTDYARTLGLITAYHICGFSRELVTSGKINSIKPTWFETFSTAPCGNHRSLSESLAHLDPQIISKGNLSLELLRNGTPAEIRVATEGIIRESNGRRHIIGQADGTILSGTPPDNIRAFLEASST